MIAYIGIGSNLGDRKENILAAIELIGLDKKIKLIKKSRICQTEPVGGPKQGKFLNGAIKIKTEYSARKLLERLKEIENILGRKKSRIKWGPRLIDLDILFYGRRVIKDKKITVPHPEIENRLFVLKPLSQIAPYLKHPVSKNTVRRLLKKYEADKKH